MNLVPDNAGQTLAHRSWQWRDNIWTLGLYGTAVGAGTLFLPIEIGTRGPVIFLVMLLLGLPLSLMPHLLLCRVYMKEAPSGDSALPVFGSFFRGKGELAMLLFYCLTFFPVTLVYGTSLVNALDNYLTTRLHFHLIHRSVISFIVVACLYAVLSKGRDKVVSTLSALALPFAISIVLIAVSQIPHWHLDNFTGAIENVRTTPPGATFKGVWLTLPLIAFSFCCAPMISPLASWYREKQESGERKALRVIRVAYAAIFISIIFFVLSCVLSIPQATFIHAKAQNLNVLSIMTGGEGGGMVYYVAPFIAILGMTKSFLGVGLSVADTLARLLSCAGGEKRRVGKGVAWLLMFAVTFGVVDANPDVITLIETICGPMIAVILFLIPAWLIYTREELRSLRGAKAIMVIIGGLATLSALFYSMI